MNGGYTIWLVTYLNGQIVGMTAVVRPVFFVAGSGTTLPSSVGRLIGSTPPPATGPAPLASAWFSSRSQLAAHAAFAFEREWSYNKWLQKWPATEWRIFLVYPISIIELPFYPLILHLLPSPRFSAWLTMKSLVEVSSSPLQNFSYLVFCYWFGTSPRKHLILEIQCSEQFWVVWLSTNRE